jgi:hypothetical protein
MKPKRKPRPPDCDREVFEDGKVVVMLGNVSSAVMEDWVKSLRECSGERIDWHYAAGRAVVKVIGDIALVTLWVRNLGLPKGATA